MSQPVFVTKNTLFNILGNASMSLAMFMASGTQEGTAFKILLENVDDIDLNCNFIQNIVIPTLIQASVLSQADANVIQSYINNTLGVQ